MNTSSKKPLLPTRPPRPGQGLHAFPQPVVIEPVERSACGKSVEVSGRKAAVRDGKVSLRVGDLTKVFRLISGPQREITLENENLLLDESVIGVTSLVCRGDVVALRRRADFGSMEVGGSLYATGSLNVSDGPLTVGGDLEAGEMVQARDSLTVGRDLLARGIVSTERSLTVGGDLNAEERVAASYGITIGGRLTAKGSVHAIFPPAAVAGRPRRPAVIAGSIAKASSVRITNGDLVITGEGHAGGVETGHKVYNGGEIFLLDGNVIIKGSASVEGNINAQGILVHGGLSVDQGNVTARLFSIVVGDYLKITGLGAAIAQEDIITGAKPPPGEATTSGWTGSLAVSGYVIARNGKIHIGQNAPISPNPFRVFGTGSAWAFVSQNDIIASELTVESSEGKAAEVLLKLEDPNLRRKSRQAIRLPTGDVIAIQGKVDALVQEGNVLSGTDMAALPEDERQRRASQGLDWPAVRVSQYHRAATRILVPARRIEDYRDAERELLGEAL